MHYSGLTIVTLSIFFVITTNTASVYAVDLYYTDITPVTNETRYTTLHPEVDLNAFDKLRHVKGNFVFSAGQRIQGDRIILIHLDETTFTKNEDIEVLLRYPADESSRGAKLTRIEIFVDLSAWDADAYFTHGGIDRTYAQILLTSEQARHFTYEIFIYGY